MAFKEEEVLVTSGKSDVPVFEGRPMKFQAISHDRAEIKEHETEQHSELTNFKKQLVEVPAPSNRKRLR